MSDLNDKHVKHDSHKTNDDSPSHAMNHDMHNEHAGHDMSMHTMPEQGMQDMHMDHTTNTPTILITQVMS